MLRRMGECAPCLVPEPVSSLSKMAMTRVALAGVSQVSSRALSEAKAMERSSMRPDWNSSPCMPTNVAGSRG